MTTETTGTIKARTLAIDITDYCRINRDLIKCVRAVYLYDDARPSDDCAEYDLRFVRLHAEFTDAAYDSHELRQLAEEEEAGLIGEGGEDEYMDGHRAEALSVPVDNVPFDEDEYGEGYEEVIERLIDNERANPRFA